MIRADTEAATHLGLNDVKMGADEVSFSQKQMTPEELKEINEMQQRLAQINQKIAKDHMFL